MIHSVRITNKEKRAQAAQVLTSVEGTMSFHGDGSIAVNQQQYDMLVAAGVITRKQKSLRGLQEVGSMGDTVILEDGHSPHRYWWYQLQVRCANKDCECAFRLGAHDRPLRIIGHFDRTPLQFYTVPCPQCLYPNTLCLDT